MADKKSHTPLAPDNQGEGNREAAREYNEAQQRFVEQGKVDEAARKAKKDLEADVEKDELGRAEKEGKARAKEFDPNVKRDY